MSDTVHEFDEVSRRRIAASVQATERATRVDRQPRTHRTVCMPGQGGGTSVQFFILRGYHPGSGEDGVFVLGEQALHSDTDPWDGRWVTKSEAEEEEPSPIVLATYPHVAASYYAQWFWPLAAGATNWHTDVLLAYKIGGAWTLDRPMPVFRPVQLTGNPIFAPRCEGIT